jgi:hypothetical protein
MRASVLLAAVIAVSATAAAAQNSQAPQTYPIPPPPPPVIATPGGNDVPTRIDATDRTTRCMQYGASIGVPRDQMVDYTPRCALQ